MTSGILVAVLIVLILILAYTLVKRRQDRRAQSDVIQSKNKLALLQLLKKVNGNSATPYAFGITNRVSVIHMNGIILDQFTEVSSFFQRKTGVCRAQRSIPRISFHPF